MYSTRFESSIEDIRAHISNIKAFMSPTAPSAVLREAVRQHLNCVLAALSKIDRQMTSLKRKLDAKSQEANLLKKQLPPKSHHRSDSGFLIVQQGVLYQTTDIRAHISGIKAFMLPTASAAVPCESVRHHINYASAALTDIERQITTLKRKLDVKTQEADVLRKQLPPRSHHCSIMKDVSTVVYYTHAFKFKILCRVKVDCNICIMR